MEKKRVLVIDDEEELLKALEVRLGAAGFEVILARDGQEGINLAREGKADLILLDIMMPKIDGYEVCRLLKFDEPYQDIPIIMLTAKNREVDKATGSETGADDYVTKPFDSAELIEKIKRLL